MCYLWSKLEQAGTCMCAAVGLGCWFSKHPLSMTGAVSLKMVKELLQDAEHDGRPAKSKNNENITRVCTVISDCMW